MNTEEKILETLGICGDAARCGHSDLKVLP